MNALAIYAVAAVIILLLSLLIVVAFARYRFKGDRTVPIIALFYLMFIGIILLTFTLLHPASSSAFTPSFQ